MSELTIARHYIQQLASVVRWLDENDDDLDALYDPTVADIYRNVAWGYYKGACDPLGLGEGALVPEDYGSARQAKTILGLEL